MLQANQLHRIAATTALSLILTFVGCSVVNAPDPPSDPDGDGGSTSTSSSNGGSGGSVSCTAPEVDCGGVCADTMSDPDHCGGCGNGCAPGEFCVAASCQADCGNLTQCGTQCIDTDNDHEHCGGCDMPCDTMSICAGGSCTSCMAGELACDNVCTDVTGDAMNCGSCGNQCTGMDVCIGSNCGPAIYPNCNALKTAAPNAPSGIYSIDPNGGATTDAFDAYCDMTTDGGGWTLVLNRLTDSDNNGQPDLDMVGASFDNARATNWNYNINLFWNDFTEVAFAAKENDLCPNCEIGGYDSAIKAPKPPGGSWSRNCTANSTASTVTKLVGPGASQTFQGYMCAATLGWGACAGSVCHYGIHHQPDLDDGQWSQNNMQEMHFPSAYSSYRNFGDVNNPPSAWCRSCAGGLANIFNQSSTCCRTSGQFNARSRWTIWLR